MAHSDIDPAAIPARRIGGLALLTYGDTVGMVLPNYKLDQGENRWQLPGGGARRNESAATAAERELQEETGLVRRLTHLLLSPDWIEENEETQAPEGYNFVFDGGELTVAEAEAVAVPEAARRELIEFAWVRIPNLSRYCKPYQERRIRLALTHRRAGLRMPFTAHGVPLG
ncbi:hypothetical protein CFP65_3312 [Kitasatospora sp. MMS16-BH015]|uniref:NUDIX domain-containing protein n=1 Tax=Kitasatospora sp. MMS16-BH015 TaxID=2018025 RepID=UPI000CA0F74A|nr:NUDIX hydrolase [Kitasatospora sp. MMS16-BH015]AUG78112.1 hypothetical protein CFP65_3312 [Kitasatospora sp. MMS16-BH015]